MDTSMGTDSSARPTGITIIGWLWLVIGAFMLFSALMGGLGYSMMRQPGMQSAADLPREFALMNWVFQNFAALVAVQCVIAVVALWAGIDLLRLKAWARSAVEVLCWVGVIWTLGFGIYWVYMWISMAGQAPAAADASRWIGAAMGAVVTLVFAVPLAIMIRYLRGNEARQAMSRSAVTG